MSTKPEPRKRLPHGHVKRLLQSIDPNAMTASEFSKLHNIPYTSVYAAARALSIRLKPAAIGRPNK